MRQLPNRQKKDFNPRSREGSDFLMLMEDSDYIEFQSTLPRRERLLIALIYLVLPYFNPRSHEGSDDTDGHFVLGVTGFQSTLPRRERRCNCVKILQDYSISIHAPTKGATGRVWQIYFNAYISIHAPTKGATHPAAAIIFQNKISIHAPTKGATSLLVS